MPRCPTVSSLTRDLDTDAPRRCTNAAARVAARGARAADGLPARVALRRDADAAAIGAAVVRVAVVARVVDALESVGTREAGDAAAEGGFADAAAIGAAVV